MDLTKGILTALVLISASGCQYLPSTSGRPISHSGGKTRFVTHAPKAPNAWTRNQVATSSQLSSPTTSRSFDEAVALANRMTAGADLRVALVADTGSMQPYLGESCLVIIDPYAGQSLRVGSLITFTRDGAEFVHVVVGITPNGVVTKGSASNSEELVPLSNVSGLVSGTIYFNPETTPSSLPIPTLLASSASHLPESAGTLRVTGTSLIEGANFPNLVTGADGAGEYKMELPRDTSVSISIGSPVIPNLKPASTSLTWSEKLAGQTVEFRIYHPEAPKAGQVSLMVHFAP